MSPVSSFKTMRTKSGYALAVVCWPLGAVSLVIAGALGNSVLPIAVMSGGCALLAAFGAFTGGPNGRLGISLGLIGQAIALTAALAGHPWQLDSHMLFFVLLAITMSLADIRAVVTSCICIAVHHIGLTFVMPALVYPTSDVGVNSFRTIFHSAAVLMETVPLCLAIRARARLDQVAACREAELTEARRASEAATADVLASRREVEAALGLAEVGRTAAETAQREVETKAALAREADAAARAAEEAHRARIEKDAAVQEHVVAVLSRGLDRLAAKDLSCDISDPLPGAHDTLRIDFNAALAALRDALDQVADDARLMVGEGDHLRKVAVELSDRADAQTRTVEATATRIGNVIGRVRVIVDGATRADGMIHDVQGAAAQADLIVRDTASSMGELRQAAVEIEQTVRTIEDISFQTNLLSLNAGIEAARAGDAGRGFGVVAAEVGALARRSAEAARKIDDLAVQSRLRVDAGVVLVDSSVAALDHITQLVQEVLAAVSDIAGAAGVQSDRLTDIDSALEALGRIARENGAAAMNSVAAATQIGDRASRLDLSMATFKRSVRDQDTLEPKPRAA